MLNDKQKRRGSGADAAVGRRPYGTARWLGIRAKQLRDESLCRFCIARGIVTLATVCDHVDPHRGDEGKFFDGPFQSLCADCHDVDKQRIENGGKARPAIDDDGWPIDVM